MNALGIVDRAIQQLKLNISEMLSTNKDRTWVDALPDAVKALNSYPKDVLHGATPSEVRGGEDPQVKFMLLEDQAKNAETNTALTKRRVAKLAETGAFRAALPESTTKFKRGVHATCGDVQHAGNVQGSTVTDGTGKEMDIKRVKAVPIDSSSAQTRVGATNERLQAQKRQQSVPIIPELCKLLADRDQISLVAAAAALRKKMAEYNAILKATHSKLIDLVRLAPERVRVVSHAGAGAKTCLLRSAGRVSDCLLYTSPSPRD